jgi:cellulose synthase/poly-beta-1,6-N-acetylglucosamine synthase-like glycosyltransferase
VENFVSLLLMTCAALLAVPATTLLIEIIAGALRSGKCPQAKANSRRGVRLAVLVPAHNESVALKPTLEDVRQQLKPGDRVIVIADNCTDDTTTVARACGAEVIERCDCSRRGKGYALDFGLKHLNFDPPDILIMVDADCRLEDGAVDQLATICMATRRPVQAAYLMMAPSDFKADHRLAEFAWRVKNWLRPLGLSALKLPCQLSGTGMAFPWDVIRRVDLASGSIVEDLKLGLDLALRGNAPIFCPSARVNSQFASSPTGARTQRERWERGHLMTIVASVPRLMSQAFARRDINLLAMTLDLAVPPLSLLTFLASGMFVVTCLYALFGFSWWPFVVSGTMVVALFAAFGVAWVECGRDLLPTHEMFSIPVYAIKKIGLYFALLLNKIDAQWIRTDRSQSK